MYRNTQAIFTLLSFYHYHNHHHHHHLFINQSECTESVDQSAPSSLGLANSLSRLYPCTAGMYP